jgi:hypothetical protein
MFHSVAGYHAGEAFIFRNGKAYFVFDIVVWIMLTCRAAVEPIQMRGKDFALRDEPAMAGVKFGKDFSCQRKGRGLYRPTERSESHP